MSLARIPLTFLVYWAFKKCFTSPNPLAAKSRRLTSRTDASVDGKHCGNNNKTRMELSIIRCVPGDHFSAGHERRQAREPSTRTDYRTGQNIDHNRVVD